MKFGKQLQLGIYEPWREYYVQYDRLKRIINRKKFLAEKMAEKMAKLQGKGKGETNRKMVVEMADLDSGSDDNSPVPSAKYSSSSYQNPKPEAQTSSKEEQERLPLIAPQASFEEGTDFFAVLHADVDKINKFFVGKLASLRISLEEILSERKNSYRAHHTSSSASYLLRLRDIYIDLKALIAYSGLNRTAFYKIIKKYDKVFGEKNLSPWLVTIDKQAFSSAAEPTQLLEIVTGLVSRDKLLEWERFADERQAKSLDEIFPSVRVNALLFSFGTFLLTLCLPHVIPSDPAASRCMCLLVFAVLMWITEAIPYFATALLIPILVTFMGVLKDPKDATRLMDAEQASQFVMNSIFNHTTMLLLGGYTISTAFSRCQLELRIASKMQKYYGSNPQLFILAVMFLGLFLSMWISNHTAPILCSAIILPIVRDLPNDSRFTKALLLGLAYACNFGGMVTPISSLQNVLAVYYLEQNNISISFGKWLLISIPFCSLCTLVAWLLIIYFVQPNDISSIPAIVYERGNVFSKRNVTVMTLTASTLVLFAMFTYLKPYAGDIGIVSLSFVAIMFGSGMLSEVDFNSLSWHTLFLVGGGNVLGKAIQSSGLLGYLSDVITFALPLSDPWLAFVFILFFSGAVATFISHTVASLILMPIIVNIGITLGIPQMMVIGTAFAVSAAMGLPFSSFPNVNSLLIVDDFQRPYLNVQDFLKTGMIMSGLSVVLIATIGYGLIKIIL